MPGPRGWVRRLAAVVPGATLGLIVAGGLVTNTGAALAVPDWPTTFGESPFLYPWSRMVDGILFEHSHRLIGAGVGLLTVALGVALWCTERRRWLWGLGALAVGLVAVQGLVGGLRVLLLRDTLAVVHGCLAQAFFALTVTLAVVTAPAWTAPVRSLPARSRHLPGLAAAVALAVYGQIVLGALTTHAGWVLWHLGGAVVAGALVAILTRQVLGLPDRDSVLVWWGRALGVLVGLQLMLGLGAYTARFTGWTLPGGEVSVVALPVAHRAVGALLLGATVALMLQLWRRREAAGVMQPVTPRFVSTEVVA